MIRDQAARFGVQPAAMDDILYDAFGQREVAQYFTGNKAYYVSWRRLPDQQGQLSTLQKLYVTSSSGQAVPLSTLVHETIGARAAGRALTTKASSRR